MDPILLTYNTVALALLAGWMLSLHQKIDNLTLKIDRLSEALEGVTDELKSTNEALKWWNELSHDELGRTHEDIPF